MRAVALPFLLFLLAPVAFPTRGDDVPASASAEVSWDAGRPISWSDFRGVPPQDAAWCGEAAAIHMTLGWHALFKVSYVPQTKAWKGTVDRAALSVTNTMDPTRSWGAPGKERPDILRHEQRHFDLSEVYRRKLFDALSVLQAEGGSPEVVEETLQKKIQETASAILARAKELQTRYDAETDHGKDPSKQADWGSTILLWLAEPAKAP